MKWFLLIAVSVAALAWMILHRAPAEKSSVSRVPGVPTAGEEIPIPGLLSATPGVSAPPPGRAPESETVPAARLIALLREEVRKLLASQPSPEKAARDAQAVARHNAAVLASEWRAVAVHPDLAKAGSPIHRLFLNRYRRWKDDENSQLDSDDWPERLGRTCATQLDSLRVARSSSAPAPAVTQGLSGGAPSPPSPTLAVAAGPLPSVVVEAVAMNSGGRWNYEWWTDWGSYDLTGRANRAVAVTLTNLSPWPAEVSVEWVFTCQSPRAPAPRQIFDLGTRRITLTPGRMERFGLRSADLSQRIQHYAALGQEYVRGAQIEGWVVAVRPAAGGPVIRSVASKSQLDDLIRDDVRLRALVAAFQQDPRSNTSPEAKRPTQSVVRKSGRNLPASVSSSSSR